MTHTLELAPDVERALERKARRRGVPLDDYLRALVEDDAQAPEIPKAAHNGPAHGAPRLRGLLAHLPGTVDDFLQERHAEALRELQQDTLQGTP